MRRRTGGRADIGRPRLQLGSTTDISPASLADPRSRDARAREPCAAVPWGFGASRSLGLAELGRCASALRPSAPSRVEGMAPRRRRDAAATAPERRRPRPWPRRRGSSRRLAAALAPHGAAPPSERMSAGMRSSAMTATAPASSAMRACSGVTTSMITPPLSILAMPCFTLAVPVVVFFAPLPPPMFEAVVLMCGRADTWFAVRLCRVVLRWQRETRPGRHFPAPHPRRRIS